MPILYEMNVCFTVQYVVLRAVKTGGKAITIQVNAYFASLSVRVFFFYCSIWFPVFTFIKSGCQRTTFILFIYILLGISKMAILLNGYPPEAIQSTRCVWYMNEEDILINYRVRNQQYWYACLCQPCSPFNDEDIYF